MPKSLAKSVLVVEDDLDINHTIQQALAGEGFHVSGVAQVSEAERKLKSQSYTGLVVDLRLGHESGIDLVEAIRLRPDYRNRNTPILIISANLDQDAMQRLRGKVQGALVKPVELASLLSAVKKLVGDA